MQLNAFSKGTGFDLVAIRKTLRIMKAVIVMILVFCLQASAKTYSQELTLSLSNATLEKVFKEIQKQADYHFIYTKDQMAMANKVSLEVKNEKLETVLQVCFKDQPLTYTIDGNIVAVLIKDKPSEQQPLSLMLKGRVVNENGEAVIATVTVKGTKNSVSSDAQGYFQLNDVDEDAILVVTGVNIESYEIRVKGRNDLGVINVKTKIIEGENVQVVSTGYQQIPKERATGSFEQPDRNFFNSRVSTDVLSKLEGITSGVLFNMPGITGANDIEIAIRGRSTIFANAQPLIVVDNFPYEGDIRNINPNDVENVTVLKDAAASSIWGARAGNGVIVITTKHGGINEPLKISVNENLTIIKKPDLFYNPNFLNSSDFIDVEKILFNQNFYDGAISTGYEALTPVVEILRQQRNGTISQRDALAKIDALRSNDVRNDLSKYFYHTAVNQQYSMNFSGGGKNSAYSYSLGYDRNNFNQIKSNYERFTVNAVNTFFPLKHLSFTTGINYVNSTSSSDNTLSSLLTAFKGSLYPYAAVSDEGGNALSVETQYSRSFIESSFTKGFFDWKYSPLTELRNGANAGKQKGDDIRLSGSLSYRVVQGLRIELKYQYQRNIAEFKNVASLESFYTRNLINMYSEVDANGNVAAYNINPGSILSTSNSSNETNNFRGQFTYNNSWHRHTISAIIGAEAKESTGKGKGNYYYGYDENTGSFENVNTTSLFVVNPYGYSAKIPTAGLSLNGSTDRFRSYFENIAYTYSSKYTISTSARIDASNFFGVKTNEKKVPLWSVGGKWDIDKEHFYGIKWLPYLKLRVTYGYSGNLDRSVTAITTFKYFDFRSPLTNLNFASISNLGNPELRWERVGIFNVGVDFGLISGIIQGSIEYYNKNGKDLIGDAILDPTTGIDQLRGNFSSMKGKGIDVKITTININKAVKWRTTILFNWNADEITKYDGKIIPSNLISSDKNLYPHVKNPLFGIYSYKWAGLDPLTGDPQGYDAQKQISKNYAALINPVSFDDLAYNGPARPQIFGAINNHLSYKNFMLSISISYKLHYYFRSKSINYYSLFHYLQGNKDFSNRWQAPGDELHTDVPSMPSVVNLNPNRELFYNYSEINVQRGDHVRIQDINLSYTFSQANRPSFPISKLEFFINCSNVGLIWRANKKNLDPDYPLRLRAGRSISFGIKSIF